MLPGSHVVSDPKMMIISREECVGRWLGVFNQHTLVWGLISYLMLALAISIAFCRLGSPVGSSLCRSLM